MTRTLTGAGRRTAVKNDETLQQAAQRIIRRGPGLRKAVWHEDYDQRLESGETVSIRFIDRSSMQLDGSMYFRLEVHP